jgi:hypothetical protein
MPVVIGGDAHKRTHTIVTVDEAGCRVKSRSTVSRPMPRRRAMAAFASPSRWKSRWTSAQSST